MYNSNTVITLNRAMKNTNYIAIISFNGTSTRESAPAAHTYTTTSFKVVHTAGLNNGFGVSYRVCGK